MALFGIAYLITGAAVAWFCGVTKPLSLIVTIALWPVIAAFVIIDMASDREA